MKNLILFLGAVTAFSSAWAVDLTGTWKAEFDTQIGMQKYTYTLKQDGKVVTGKASADIAGEKRESELKEGKIDNDTVSFVEMLSFQGNEIKITYTGKIAENEIKFVREVGEFAKEELVAKREAPTSAPGGTANLPTLKDAYKDKFNVGVAINRTMALNAAVRADNVNRTHEQVEKDIALAKSQFNQIAPENDLKWQLIHPREGADGYDFAPADAYVKFGEDNKMLIIGHTLVWHSQTPNWVFAGTIPAPEAPPSTTAPAAGKSRRNFGYNGPRASREELLQRMRDHIHTVVGRYKGKVKVWDVVNEAIADNGTEILRNSLWLQIIGPDFIAKAFEYAHEADPDAILRYNDYGLENPAKRQKCIALIKSLLEQHVPVTAIGSQTHVNVASPDFEGEDRTLTELEALGLPIHITELDVNVARAGQTNTGADVASNAATTQGGLIDEANQRLATQ